jgi:2-polyprenyl-3-methyl-5-hydroxy-6-metoxy-1,4-benzoquinol methylase
VYGVRNIVYDPPKRTDKAERNAELIHKHIERRILSLMPSSVLEVGSGQGKLGGRLSAQGIRYVGLEPVASEISAAGKQFPGLKFMRASCDDDPDALHLGKFDVVTSNDVVEHLYEPRVLVQFSKAHLNRGGRIVCGTPNYGDYLRNLMLSASNRWDAHHTSLWDGGHIKFFSQRTLGMLWAEAGFSDFQWGFLNYSYMPGVSWYLYCSATLA